MSLPLPFAVVLTNGRTVRHITRDVRDARFGWSDPGGYRTATVALDRPISLQPDEVSYYGQMTIYDTRTGRVQFDGRLEDPGRSARDGQVWDLAAVGGQAHTRDRTVPLIYVDRDLTRWAASEVTALPDGQRRIGEDETVYPGEASIIAQIPNGTPLQTNSLVSTRYMPIYRSGQKISRFGCKWKAGRTTASLRLQALTRQGGAWSTFTVVRDESATTAGGAAAAWVIGTNWTAGRDALDLRLLWSGAAATVGDDVTWGAWADIAVLATRYDKSGSELLTGASYTSNTVLASDVVADLLGRLLTAYDGAGATIATTTYGIEQLAYPDGVTPYQVLTDLMGLEAGYTWRVWERNTAGKHRFEWVTIPTSVRYEADVRDGYDSQGSADGLYNQVTVRWRDAAGAVRTTVRTSTVPALTAAGLTRQGILDLGDEVASLANAQRAGDQWLADRRYAPNAGRLRITRPVLDVQTGMMVQPWEIRPGLIRVRGVAPRLDALNASTRDGATVMRIVGMEYATSDASATLELDSYAPSTARLLADLRQRRDRRR